MATISSSPQSVAVSSKITVKPTYYTPGSGQYYERSSAAGYGSVTCSVSVPAGSIINSASFSCYINGATLYGGTTKVNDVKESSGNFTYTHNPGAVTSVTYNFYFKSTASNGYGGTPNSTTTPVRSFDNCVLTVDYTPYTACGAATSVTVDSTNVAPGAATTLRWYGATNGSNNAIASFNIYRSTSSGGTYDYIGNVAAWTATVYAPTTNGASYYYKVIAIGSVSGYNSGWSPASGAFTCSFSAPTAPSSITFASNNVAPGATVAMSWTGHGAGTNNPITKYEVYRSTSSGGTFTLLSSPTSASLNVTAPTTNGSSYYYKILVKGTYSDSGYSAVSGAFTCSFSAPSVSAVKVNSSSSAIYLTANTNLTLSWTGTAGTNNPITSYTILKNGSAYLTGITGASTTVATSTSSGDFYYTVQPIGTYSNGSSVNSPYVYTYTACTAPTTLTVGSTNVAPNASVTLSWSGAGNGGANNTIAGYNIYRSTTSAGTYSLLTSVTTTASSGSVSVSAPASNGGTYFYKVITVGTQQNSNYSSASSALTCSFSSPSVSNPVFSKSPALKGSEVTLSWSSTNGTNNPIVSYDVYRDDVFYSNVTAAQATVVSHATESSSYSYKVQAVGEHSTGSFVLAPVLYSFSSATAPTSVTVSSASVSPSTTVTLSWSGAAGGGTYNPITGYAIYRSESSSSGYSLLTSISSTATSGSITVTSPSTNSTAYYYKVVTKCQNLDSEQSTVFATLTTYFTAPAVSGVKISGSSSDVYVLAGSTTSVMSWTGTNGTNNPIVSYNIFRNGVSWATTTSTSYSVVSNPTAGSNFVYTIYPVGQYSSGSGVDSPTYYSCSLPTLPTAFSANPVSPDANTLFTISWSGASGGVLNAITGYEIYKSSSLNGTYTLFATTSSTSTTDTSHSTMTSSYFYKIKVIGEHLSSELSSALTVTSKLYTVPFPPNTVSLSKTFTIVPNEDITLSWSAATAGTNNPITTYQIYRSTSENGTYALFSTTSSTTATVKSNENYGGKYYYKVRTVGTKEGFLNSDFSDTVMVETSLYTYCTPPTSLKVNGGTSNIIVDTTSATLSWLAGSSGVNNPVTGYSIQERVYSESNQLLQDWRNATDLSGTPSYSTASTSFLVYPPAMYQYKKFRVKAVGTASGFDSEYVELTSKVYRKIYTALSAPVIATIPNVVEQSFNLTWSGVIGGVNNAISGYLIQYCESADGSSWGSWTTITTITSSSSSGAYTVSTSSTRGHYRRYRIQAQGTASSDWYSPFAVSSVVKANLLPAVPAFNFPKTSKIIYGPNVYVGATLGSEPESQPQKIAYEVIQSSVVIASGESPFYATSGNKVFRINMGSFTNSTMTLKIRSVDSLGGASDYVQVTLTGQTLTWTRTISAGMVISNHIADINDLLSKVNTIRDSYGLSAITLTGTVGHFSSWYPQMIQIRNAVSDVYQLVQSTSPVWISSSSGYPNAAIFNQIKTAVMNLI